MGYLDGSTITVDAVLTKHGRRLLSRGQALGINSFCLSDTGIDYNLWNVDHPSGSAFYGEAIENLPQTEALSQGEYEMRNRLVTLPRNTTALPILDLDQPDAFSTKDNVAPERNIRSWSVATLNYSPSDSWVCVTPNRQFLAPIGTTWKDISGLAHMFVAAADIPAAGMIELREEGDGRGYIKFRPAADDQDRYTTLTFISLGTGTWAAHSNLKVPKTVIKVNVSDV
jgi:hypothetical protein